MQKKQWQANYCHKARINVILRELKCMFIVLN